MTNLTERLEKHIQSIREDNTYKVKIKIKPGVISYGDYKEIYEKPSKAKLNQLFKDNKLSVFYMEGGFDEDNSYPLVLKSVLWYGVDNKKEYDDDLIEGLFRQNILRVVGDFADEFLIDNKTRTIIHTDLFSWDPDRSPEAADAIQTSEDAIEWGKFFDIVIKHYNLKWGKYQKYINNWLKGKLSDGREIE